jgi:high-affinity iron transporter
MGVWLGLYPTWEGLLIPFGTFAYVGGMWLFVKLSARRAQQREARLESSAPLAA